jgi:hypothetical protein
MHVSKYLIIPLVFRDSWTSGIPSDHSEYLHKDNKTFQNKYMDILTGLLHILSNNYSDIHFGTFHSCQNS